MSVEFIGVRLPLAHFTLEVDAVLSGRVTAIFGPSGAGKTSLLEIIAGLRRPSAGIVRVDGTLLSDAAAKRFVPPEQRSIGYVPQEGALFPHLSVRENLLYGWKPHVSSRASLTLERVSAVLEVSELVDRPISTLSGGEKQRVSLGRALLAAPRLLLFDEPLAGLDVALRDRLLPYLARVRDEFSIPMLYVTHAPDEVMGLCDDVLALARGRIEQQGAPTDLFRPTDKPHFVRK